MKLIMATRTMGVMAKNNKPKLTLKKNPLESSQVSNIKKIPMEAIIIKILI